MLPKELVTESFRSYPEEARRLATSHISLLRQLPLGFVPLLLREVIVHDWKFPAERKDIEHQFTYLESLPAEQLSKAMAVFSSLRLPDALGKVDWVNSPAVFTEQLTAHLWTTHQIDAFRAAAVEYIGKSTAALPDTPLPAPRLGIVVIGQGVRNGEYALFRKLRPKGVYFSRVKHADGMNTLMSAVAQRAAAHPVRYGHWHIDGGVAPAPISGSVAHISYAALAPVRARLQTLMQKSYEASVFDPEAFRTRLAQTRLEEVGANSGGDGLLNRFQLSLLTEGSGTQVFATTFVQWAARETLRRAQPLTLLARFTPRQRENPMNELLAEAQRRPELDPQGSLVDADMGAYYTWLNQQRLTGAKQSNFLAWFEDHEEAVAVGPAFEPARRSDAPIELREIVAQLV